MAPADPHRALRHVPERRPRPPVRQLGRRATASDALPLPGLAAGPRPHRSARAAHRRRRAHGPGRLDRRGWHTHAKEFPTEREAVQHIARSAAGGLRFHDLRHSYATWLVDDGEPPNMVQRVMGHERSATTLDLYTRRTNNADRILEALNDHDDPGDDDPDDGAAGVPAPI
ncbi:site-specific integrase [Pseudonocardia sp.]|uniref:site-specific integrase n=1 Tax=Pseudonocardia sp. TaxID=60912 RepID=UPI003D13D4AF